MTQRTGRGTIFLEQAEILQHTVLPANQYVLRVRSPKAARHARPGSFAHIRCAASVPLRRPLSIMRTDPTEAWLEFLYKPVGIGLEQLALRQPGESLSILAPIGNGFEPNPARSRVLAIGGGVGIPPMIFLSQVLRDDARFAPVVLMGSEVPFPFEIVRSTIRVDGVPDSASHGMSLLEQWDIPSRLASNASLPGSFVGFVTELARAWLDNSTAEVLAATQIVACGPEPMLRATARLASNFNLPCELALEEYMACAVGGCAGCTVLVETDDGPAMKRVCVDGPVFDARAVYPSR